MFLGERIQLFEDIRHGGDQEISDSQYSSQSINSVFRTQNFERQVICGFSKSIVVSAYAEIHSVREWKAVGIYKMAHTGIVSLFAEISFEFHSINSIFRMQIINLVCQQR